MGGVESKKKKDVSSMKVTSMETKYLLKLRQ